MLGKGIVGGGGEADATGLDPQLGVRMGQRALLLAEDGEIETVWLRPSDAPSQRGLRRRP